MLGERAGHLAGPLSFATRCRTQDASGQMRRVPRWVSIAAICVVLAIVISLAVAAASSLR